MLVPSAFRPHVGGVEQVTDRLARGLLDRGISVLVVTNQEPRDLPSHESVEGLDVARIPFRVPHRSVRGIGSWLALSWRSRKQLVDLAVDVDLIHVHCVSSQASYVRAAARALKVPLVVTTHGEISMDAAQTYQRDARAIRQWRRLAMDADLVTAPSQYALDEAAGFLGRPFRSARVIGNGVDLVDLGDRASNPDPFVLGAGRLVDVKGFDVLVSSWHRLPGGLDARLVIAGDGPARPALERLRAESPVADRIELIGARSQPEVQALMRSAAAFVLPSREEAFGLVLLEAMVGGAPVIASRVGGVPEIIQEGETGLLFDRDDVAGLIAAVASTLSDPVEARKRAERARVWVSAHGWTRMVDEYLEAYAQVGCTP